MPAAIKFTQTQIDQIVEQYQQGKRIIQLAKELGFGQKPVTKVLIRAGLHTLTPRQYYVLEGKAIEISQFYEQGENVTLLAKRYGVKVGVMNDFFRRSNIKVRPQGNLDGKQDQIIADYLSGQSMNSIAKKYRVCPANSIRKVLSNDGQRIRSGSEFLKGKLKQIQYSKYIRDETVLDQIDSEEKAYFMGFFYADGYNNQRHGRMHLGIEIQARDEAILHRFSTLFTSNRPLITNPKRNSVTFWIHSTRLSNRMAELGCPQAKSLILTYPTWLQPSLTRHFIRGYVDGDGCIYAKGKQKVVSIVGSTAFNEHLMPVLSEVCQVNTAIRPTKSAGICTGFIYGGRQVKRVLAYLYNDCTIYLERKKAKADAILNEPLG